MGLVLEVGGKSKDGFNYDYPIETNKPSAETNKVDSFILSTGKIKQSGFCPEYGDKEIRLLLDYCNNNY